MRLTTGLLTHNSERYAARCLESLVSQENLGTLSTDWQIIVLDNASEDRSALLQLEQQFPQVTFIREEQNLGFAKAHNRIMRQFPADFFAVLNSDVLFSPDFLTALLQELEKYPEAGSAVGKLLWWNIDGNPEQTTIIDSVGIEKTPSLAFRDIGQGKEDQVQFNEPCERFGGTGAAVLYRRSALEKISLNGGQYFDERFFMYKEDIDLSERLNRAGHPCHYTPNAVAWHARTAGKKTTRAKRSKHERIYSAAHEAVIVQRMLQAEPASVKKKAKLRQGLKWLYLLVLEPQVFFGARKLLRTIEG